MERTATSTPGGEAPQGSSAEVDRRHMLTQAAAGLGGLLLGSFALRAGAQGIEKAIPAPLPVPLPTCPTLDPACFPPISPPPTLGTPTRFR